MLSHCTVKRVSAKAHAVHCVLYLCEAVASHIPDHCRPYDGGTSRLASPRLLPHSDRVEVLTLGSQIDNRRLVVRVEHVGGGKRRQGVGTRLLTPLACAVLISSRTEASQRARPSQCVRAVGTARSSAGNAARSAAGSGSALALRSAFWALLLVAILLVVEPTRALDERLLQAHLPMGIACT